MIQQFKPAYAEYRRNVKALIPYGTIELVVGRAAQDFHGMRQKIGHRVE